MIISCTCDLHLRLHVPTPMDTNSQLNVQKEQFFPSGLVKEILCSSKFPYGLPFNRLQQQESYQM
jgi:hypothetical protein